MGRALRVIVMTAAFIAVLYALSPLRERSVIDGEEELWVTTGMGWEYRVPFPAHSWMADWMPFAIPILGAVLLALMLLVAARPGSRGGTRT